MRKMALTGLLLLTACGGGTEFGGNSAKTSADATPAAPPSGSDNVPIPPPGTKTLGLACPGGSGEARLVTDVTGAKGTKVLLQGEFCDISSAAAAAELTVTFVIDWSGSMRTNDPETNDSCGRLGAAQAVLAKLQTQLGANAAVKVAVVPFGGEVETQAIVPPTELAAFQQGDLNQDVFCRSDAGDTNYDAAFRATTQLLKPVNGAKVVYFITDGEPTSFGDPGQQGGGGVLGGILGGGGGGQDLQQAYTLGQQSADALRALTDLTFYGLYLQDQAGSTPPTQGNFTAPAPEAYLQQIAGGADHERTAANAQDLATQIKSFKAPSVTATAIDASTVKAEVAAATFGKKTVQLTSVGPVPGKTNVWQFQTEAFPLLGSDVKTENDVTITAKGADGKLYTATAVIDFTPQ